MQHFVEARPLPVSPVPRGTPEADGPIPLSDTSAPYSWNPERDLDIVWLHRASAATVAASAYGDASLSDRLVPIEQNGRRGVRLDPRLLRGAWRSTYYEYKAKSSDPGAIQFSMHHTTVVLVLRTPLSGLVRQPDLPEELVLSCLAGVRLHLRGCAICSNFHAR